MIYVFGGCILLAVIASYVGVFSVMYISFKEKDYHFTFAGFIFCCLLSALVSLPFIGK